MNTVLFDLDGTLLPMDTDQFMHDYMKLLTNKFEVHMPPKEFQRKLWEGTRSMLENNGGTFSNEEVFYRTFFAGREHDRETFIDLFEEFYQNEFDEVRRATSQNHSMIEAVSLLKKKGYRLAVATNPLFPKQAVERRIHWAGLDPSTFDLVTSFEIMHACKPNTNFYQEVIDVLAIEPSEAIMVGNDAMEDLAAGLLGIGTYLVTDCVLQERTSPYLPDHTGSMEAFYEFARQLPDIG